MLSLPSLNRRQRRLARLAVRLSGLALAALAAQLGLAVCTSIAERAVQPKPYLLLHLLAAGALLIGAAALLLARPLVHRELPARASDAALAALWLSLAAVVGYGYYVEPRWLDRPEVEVRLADLPPGLDGLRIALISDLHVGPYFGEADVERVFEATSELRPDLIALLGDYVARAPSDVLPVAERLRMLQAPLGVYAVLGNHDEWIDRAFIVESLTSGGARVLVNDGLPIERGGGRLWLAGLDDLRRGQPDLQRALAGARTDEPSVLLVHNPLLVGQARQAGVPLVLAGHTHGGQVQLPFVGALILPIPNRGWAEGLIQLRDTQMYVTRGVGVGTPPVRLGARPEIPVIVLRRG